jgi:hypothetical protein
MTIAYGHEHKFQEAPTIWESLSCSCLSGKRAYKFHVNVKRIPLEDLPETDAELAKMARTTMDREGRILRRKDRRMVKRLKLRDRHVHADRIGKQPPESGDRVHASRSIAGILANALDGVFVKKFFVLMYLSYAIDTRMQFESHSRVRRTKRFQPPFPPKRLQLHLQIFSHSTIFIDVED